MTHAHCVRFDVHAERCPQVISRVLDIFAARSIQLDYVLARSGIDEVLIAVEVIIDPVTAERLAERMRSLVTVRDVFLSGHGDR